MNNFRFMHGLGDVANFAHVVALYTRRGVKVDVECTPDKAPMFQAAGANIIPAASAIHDFWIPSAGSSTGPDYEGNKTAASINAQPLSNLGDASLLLSLIHI